MKIPGNQPGIIHQSKNERYIVFYKNELLQNQAFYYKTILENRTLIILEKIDS